MTPQEFKAWFSGFCEAIDITPSRSQWERIQEQVFNLDCAPKLNGLWTQFQNTAAAPAAPTSYALQTGLNQPGYALQSGLLGRNSD